MAISFRNTDFIPKKTCAFIFANEEFVLALIYTCILIRGTAKVGEISKKVQESRLKWYGHVLRREDEYVGKRGITMEVPGKRRRGRQKRR